MQRVWSRLSFFASVKLTVTLLVLIAATVLIGAWCPQEAQQGRAKIVETFGEDFAYYLIQLGIGDIFHSPWFLGLIGLLTLNMVACSFQRVFPKLRQLKHQMVFLGGKEISRLQVSESVRLASGSARVLTELAAQLKLRGYKIRTEGARVTGESGKVGRLAPTVTHIGLLTLLGGVTITSWTGFNGFQPVLLGETMDFTKSEHSRLWIGKLPSWKVRVDETRRENYESGDPKQWYSKLTVIDPSGKEVKTQEISVNNPLSYDGVDIYQSSWGLDQIRVSFNGKQTRLFLRPMGNTYAAFLPLDRDAILIFSVRDQNKPVRIFARVPGIPTPRVLAEARPGATAQLGPVKVTYEKVIPVTGLQYKSDPGLMITYVAFGFIICGVLLAAIPHRQLWACVSEDADGAATLYIGGASRKAKRAFEKGVAKIAEKLQQDIGTAPAFEMPEPKLEAAELTTVEQG